MRAGRTCPINNDDRISRPGRPGAVVSSRKFTRAGVDIAKYFVPGSEIREFIPVELREQVLMKMTRPPPLAAAAALPLPPTTAVVQRAYHRPDAPTFPPVAAGEAVVGMSLPAVAVAVGLPALSPGQRLQSSRRQHSGLRRCRPIYNRSRDFTASIQVRHARADKWIPSVVISGLRIPPTDSNGLMSSTEIPRFNDSSVIASFPAVIRSVKLRSEMYGIRVTTDFCFFPETAQQPGEIVSNFVQWRFIID